MPFSERPRPQLTTETGKKVEVVPLAESLNENESFGEQDFGGSKLELARPSIFEGGDSKKVQAEAAKFVERMLEDDEQVGMGPKGADRQTRELIRKEVVEDPSFIATVDRIREDVSRNPAYKADADNELSRAYRRSLDKAKKKHAKRLSSF